MSACGLDNRPSSSDGELQASNFVPAFTLVESVISILVVTVLLTAALSTVAGTGKGHKLMGDRAVARLLAEDLLHEILQQAYTDPDQSPTFGLESSENTGSRAAFDDVDDYSSWVASPPQYKDGTVMPDRTGWKRRSLIHLVDPADLSKSVASDMGVKRITVSVFFGTTRMASLIAVRGGQAIAVVGDPDSGAK